MRSVGQLRNCLPWILLAWSCWIFSGHLLLGRESALPLLPIVCLFLCPMGGYSRIQGDSAFLVHPDALKQMLMRMMEGIFSQDMYPVEAQSP